MRILLALITFFAVFQAQAYCYLTGVDVDKQPQIEADPIALDLTTGDSSVTENMNFTSDRRLSFACFDPADKTPNKFVLSASQPSNEYYLIKNGSHRLYVRIWLEPDYPYITDTIPNHSYYPATMLNSLKYKLNYSVQSNYSGTTFRNVNIGEKIKLDSYITAKPIACSIAGDCVSNFYDNTNHGYRYYITVIPKFTPTTCTFSNQEISVPEISYQDIATNPFTTPTSAQPELRCSSSTGVATSNIHYHFEAISTPDGSGKILQNELGTQPGSAGEIGFMLRNNDQDINFYPSQSFTIAKVSDPLQNSSTFPLNLQLRYASYGNKVFSGRVQSKVKVVVDYD